jgi:pyruvate dehydrogenase E2 component (dihydrolipoamide acetyltransferase)
LPEGDELMAEELFIPKLGQTVEEVTLMSWLVEDGTKVEFGQPIVEVETDKAVFPVEANGNGYLHLGPYQPGEVLPVLTVIATIGKKDETFSPGGSIAPSEEAVEITSAGDVSAGRDSTATTGLGESQTGGERRFISPRARRLAGERQVDIHRVIPTGGEGVRIVEKDVLAYLSQLPKVTPVAANMASQAGLDLAGMAGSGPKGAITKQDIEKALKEKAPTPRPAAPAPAAPAPSPDGEVTQTIPLSGVRGIIFERMGASVHGARHFGSEVDATEFVTAREKLKESVSEAWGFTPGYNDLLGLIVARALREFPSMNARVRFDGSAIEWLSRVNLGMAVDTDRGLLVPVIRDADRKGLREFGAEFRQLVERARTSRSLPDDLSGGTFTITNLGMYDIDAFTPVINLPEAAILGVGRIQEKVVPYKGEIVVRKMLTLSLVFDHRLNDGAPAARFLQRIKQYVENPFLLLG